MDWTHTQTVDAAAAVVWGLATDVTSWPEYMPTVQSVERLEEGPLRLGATAKIKQPGQGPAVWTVTEMTPGHTFSWESRRRGFAMTGTHRVEPEGAGTRSTLVLTMTGPLAPVLGPVLGPLMRRVLRTENACFAERAQQVSVGTRAAG
jgi:ribosome-associated toxin RatA of RatAB toxin-antitoxin module